MNVIPPVLSLSNYYIPHSKKRLKEDYEKLKVIYHGFA
jgi:hypothetical protein